MITIVGIQFKGMGRIYYFDPLHFTFQKDDYVVVETVRGLELGLVIIPNREVEDSQIEYELKPIIRKATKKDIEDEKRNNEQASKNFVMAADWYGKVKTFVQDVSLPGLFILSYFYTSEVVTGTWLFGFEILNWILLGASVLLTIISGVNYLVKNWKVVKD